MAKSYKVWFSWQLRILREQYLEKLVVLSAARERKEVMIY